MSIATDMAWYYSGDGTAAGSLGGAITANAVVNATSQNLFRNITDTSVETDQYYCLYLKNDSPTTHNVGLYVSTPTPHKDTSIYIGLGTAAFNANEPAIASNNIVPPGVLWLQRYFSYNPVTVGNMPQGYYKSIWLRLNVKAGASGTPMDYVRIRLVEL